MSGRVQVTLADGRRVTGYRKTNRRQSQSLPAYLLPDWTLTFDLPGTLGLMAVGALDGVIGASINKNGCVEIGGKNKEWLLSQAVVVLRNVAPYGLPNPLQIKMTRGDELATHVPAGHRGMQIIWNGQHGQLIQRGGMRLINGHR